MHEENSLHRKKGFTSFPSPARMSLTKLPLGRNNSVMTSFFPPRESLVVTSRLGTGNSRTFFLRCRNNPHSRSDLQMCYFLIRICFQTHPVGDSYSLLKVRPSPSENASGAYFLFLQVKRWTYPKTCILYAE
jgi:hypothetical protein